jgi:hypothetical protein
MQGIDGHLIVLRKHAYNFLNNNMTKLFFDFLVLLIMIFLSLEGIINDKVSENIVDAIICLLLLEILLKVYAINPSNLFLFTIPKNVSSAVNLTFARA